MFKKKYFGLIMLLPFTLSGCVKGEFAISVPYNMDISSSSPSHLKNVDSENVEALIESGHSFFLFIYSTDCGSCEITIPLLNNYISETGTLIYGYNTIASNSDFSLMKSKYPSYFYDSLLTPTMYVFDNKKGNVIDRNSFSTQAQLNRVMKQYVINDNYSFTSKKDCLDTFISTHNEYLLVSYDSSLSESYALYDSLFKGKNTKNKDVLFVDYKKDETCAATLKEIFGEQYQNKLVINVSNIKTIFDFNAEDSVVSAVNNYLNN